MYLDLIETKKARIIKASRILQAKIGMGPLDTSAVRRCEELMLNADIDFGPLAHDYLTRLGEAVRQTRAAELRGNLAIEAMTEPVMQLKAHAAMFRYPLVGDLANIMLGFLETITSMDHHVLDIVEAHHRSLKTIVTKKMQGEGGAYGKQLKAELREACRRYLNKRKL